MRCGNELDEEVKVMEELRVTPSFWLCNYRHSSITQKTRETCVEDYIWETLKRSRVFYFGHVEFKVLSFSHPSGNFK